MEHILGRHAHVAEFQIDVVRKQLTRAFAGRFSEIQDEISQSCEEYLPTGHGKLPDTLSLETLSS